MFILHELTIRDPFLNNFNPFCILSLFREGTFQYCNLDVLSSAFPTEDMYYDFSRTCCMLNPRCWISLNDGRRRVRFRNLLNMYFFHPPSISFLLYNRPILVVVNTNSTQGLWCLVVTGNFKCVHRLDDKRDNRGSATSGSLPRLL